MKAPKLPSVRSQRIENRVLPCPEQAIQPRPVLLIATGGFRRDDFQDKGGEGAFARSTSNELRTRRGAKAASASGPTVPMMPSGLGYRTANSLLP